MVPSIDGLVEIAGRASHAEAVARGVNWLGQSEVASALAQVQRALRDDREALSQPPISAVPPSPVWRDRLAAMVSTHRDSADQLPPEPLPAVAQAEADADAAVAVARLSLLEAQRAVLRVRAAALRAGDSPEVAAAVRGYRMLAARTTVSRYGGAVSKAAGGEIAEVATGRSRSILVKLGLCLATGLAYLLFLRLFQWESKSEMLPFLAPYALSGVIGGVVCTNALSWDAARVRAALIGGQRLWLVLLSKNIAMFALVGVVGLVLCVGLALLAKEPSSLLAAIAELVTMMLVWLGIGNVTSVLRPLRVEPLKARFADGTLWPFLFSFASAWVLGLGVNLILTWKFWAKESMIAELGGIWVPVLMLTLTALVTWALLTVLAVSLADLPQVRRQMLREMIDYKTAAAQA